MITKFEIVVLPIYFGIVNAVVAGAGIGVFLCIINLHYLVSVVVEHVIFILFVILLPVVIGIRQGIHLYQEINDEKE